MAKATYQEAPYNVQMQERKCETCNEPMAIEFRGEPGRVPEEILYFCINKAKNCPRYHETQ